MSDDPFVLLGLPAGFDLDESEIEQAYLARVALQHPDLVSGDDEAASRAAALNEARRTLLDPERRARALLRKHGGATKDDSLPDGFLFEIMEVRSELEEAASSGDAEEIRKWSAWADARREEYLQHVGELFQSLTDPASEDQLGAIRTTLNAWRYIERMIEQAGLVRG